MNTVYNNEIFMAYDDYHGGEKYVFIKFNGTTFTQVASESMENSDEFEVMMSYNNDLYISRYKSYDNTYMYTTIDFKTFTYISKGDPLCIYNNDLYILSRDSDNTQLWDRYIKTLLLYYGFRVQQSEKFGTPKYIANGVRFCDDDNNNKVTVTSNGGLVPMHGNNDDYDYGGGITNLIGNKYYVMDSDMHEYTLNLKSTVKPNTLILYEYGNNGRNQINLYTDKYANLKLGFNRAFYYGQSGMVWNVEIYVPYNNKWLKIQSY